MSNSNDKVCNTSSLCGGCIYMNMEYSKQLQIKTEEVKKELKKYLRKM